jgi:hypothetical protein
MRGRFGACVLIEQARAQYVPPPTPLPPPVFNPSSPYTVPQPSYRPIAPATPSASPGYVVTSPPVSERPPRTAARSDRRTSVAKTRSAHHRARSVIVRPGPESYSSYYSPFGYGYGCAWCRDGTDIGSGRRPVRDRKAQLNCRSHWRHEKNDERGSACLDQCCRLGVRPSTGGEIHYAALAGSSFYRPDANCQRRY